VIGNSLCFMLHFSIILANQLIVFTMNQNCFLKVVIEKIHFTNFIPFHQMSNQAHAPIQNDETKTFKHILSLIYLLCFYSILHSQSTSTDNPAMRSTLFTASYQLIPFICHRHHRHVCVKIFCQV